MICELCGREVDWTTSHHLVPRTRHKNKKNKKKFDREEVLKTVELCEPCHNQIHNLLTEKDLEHSFFTLDLLREEPRLKKFIAWISSKPADFQTQNKRAKDR